MNYNYFLKIGVYFAVIVLLFVLQISFFGNLSLYWQNFNLILASLSIIIFLFDFKYGLWFSLIVGILLDIYSGLFFGVFILSLLTTYFIIITLYLNFFTNRSSYSLILIGWILVIVYNFTLFFITSFFFWVGASDFNLIGTFWRGLLYQLINVSIILSLFFVVVNKFSNQFRPTYLQS